jgi:hypothetical protein
VNVHAIGFEGDPAPVVRVRTGAGRNRWRDPEILARRQQSACDRVLARVAICIGVTAKRLLAFKAVCVLGFTQAGALGCNSDPTVSGLPHLYRAQLHGRALLAITRRRIGMRPRFSILLVHRHSEPAPPVTSWIPSRTNTSTIEAREADRHSVDTLSRAAICGARVEVVEISLAGAVWRTQAPPKRAPLLDLQ